MSSTTAGWVAAIDTEALGYAVIELGGGRKRQGDAIDPSVGLEMLVRLGQRVESGEPLVRLFASDRGREEALRLVRNAIRVDDSEASPLPLVVERID